MSARLRQELSTLTFYYSIPMTETYNVNNMENYHHPHHHLKYWYIGAAIPLFSHQSDESTYVLCPM